MARKKQDPAEAAGEGISFEAALSELEAIVAAMEEEQLPLEELVGRYEKGSKLLARCETVLASARKRLQTISAKAATEAGALAEEPDESPEEDDDEPAGNSSGTPDDNDDDDDIRLF
ncbi:exodeoxyribonuclease VII small subunit [Haloferula sp. BvORR071]|uniref:exodeoxyribonuclease VII small subunit n=1 Tax=Haloferula sp. BvORR071 TaxID=1396141 RepID=UPI0009466AA9|nr:exodeoxyribonuclease VII small subunit [Haloferula sp. BvORR071]